MFEHTFDYVQTMASDAEQVWEVFRLYADRYQLDAEPLNRLEESINRRRNRLQALRRRERFLEAELATTRREKSSVEREVDESVRVAALMLADSIERARLSQGETWSPMPVLGFRAWVIRDGEVHGVRVPWRTSEMEALCLRGASGVDVPHDIGRCGPPSCGVYATKEIGQLEALVPGADSSILGLVRLTGKVIEHELGYRARKARAIAVVVSSEDVWKGTREQEVVSRFFADPAGVIDSDQLRALGDRAMAEQQMEQWKGEESWTWASSSE